MCAGTVVAPGPAASAGMVSITSRSRSVAFTASFAVSARISTFARIGMVLRRSTTRWTWPRHLRSADRSTVTFMGDPARTRRRVARGADQSAPARVYGRAGAGKWRDRADSARSPVARRRWELWLLQQPLQEFDLLRQRRVVAGERLDLAHGMQHRGVIASAEAPADLRQRAEREGLGEIHGDLARAHHIGGAARGQKVGAAHIVLPRDHALDVLDLAPLGVLRPPQVAPPPPPISTVTTWPVSLLCASSRLSAP